MTFVHDEQAHTYHLDGKLLISITDVLGSEGFSDYGFLPYAERQFYMDRGTAVAKGCQLLNEGRLEWSSLLETWEGKPWTLGYLKAYELFCREWRVIMVLSETPLHHTMYGYAGRLDLAAQTAQGLAVVQIKTGGVQDWVALQTAAELELVVANCDVAKPDWRRAKRFGLSLRPDGTYKVRRFADRRDFDVFLAALACAKWKREHGGSEAKYENGEKEEQ